MIGIVDGDGDSNDGDETNGDGDGDNDGDGDGDVSSWPRIIIETADEIIRRSTNTGRQQHGFLRLYRTNCMDLVNAAKDGDGDNSVRLWGDGDGEMTRRWR